jgi:hypothetical protein
MAPIKWRIEMTPDATNLLGFLTIGLVIATCFVLYFLPAIIAARRSHPYKGAILFINILFGFSGLGWLVAFVWAFIQPQPPQVIYVSQPPLPPWHDAAGKPVH